MTQNFEVGHSGAEGELSDAERHEIVAAQLRGEAKAAGREPEAVVEAVGEELREVGLEPDAAELHRRYEQIDPDVPVLGDAEPGPEDSGEAVAGPDRGGPESDPSPDDSEGRSAAR